MNLSGCLIDSIYVLFNHIYRYFDVVWNQPGEQNLSKSIFQRYNPFWVMLSSAPGHWLRSIK